MALHRVARFTDVPENRGLEVQIADTKILLLRVGGQLRAFQGECPHAGAPLAEGALCHGRLICPWHKAAFRIEDGALCEPPALDSLKRYPVEVREEDIWVDDQPLSDGHPPPADDARTFVIVGSGAAGTAAAAALREKGFGGRVLLIDREADAGYDRTVLSKFVIAGEMPPEEIPPLRDEDFYRKQRIERIRGEVASLDAPDKTLRLADGQTLNYDAALLATGGQPKPLELPGADLPQVFLLRSKDQAQQILDAAKPGQRAVIIGDSFIALESASSLRQYGLAVTVLARHAVPFAAQFGETVGKAIRARHVAHGVVFHTEGEAASIEGTEKVEAVLLDNGQPQRIEHWRLAQQQARIAAANMLGGDEHYLDVPFFWTWHFGKNYDYLGHADSWDEVEFKGDPYHPPFIGLFAKHGLLVAAVACEEERAMAMLAERMKQPLAVDEAWRLVRDVS